MTNEADEARRTADCAPRRRFSNILQDLAEDEMRERISVADLVGVMHGRAFGALLLLFALPNVLPTPPGTSGILGLPLVYLSAQMTFGKLPWLPPFIAARSLPRSDFAKLLARLNPVLSRVEKLLVPRFSIVSTSISEKLIGGLCLLLALVLVLPIPFGNILPALSLCLIALGVLERDGVWIIGGALLALVSLLVVYAVIYGLLKAAVFLLLNA